MWQQLGMLGFGYAFIVLSYAWVWVIGYGMSRYIPGQRLGLPNNRDLRAVSGMMAVWTIGWAVISISERLN